jgi:hypothetical protein
VLIAQCLFLKLKNINKILAVINVHTMVGEWVGIMKWTSMETSDLYIYICFDSIIVYTNIVNFNITFLLLVGERVTWWKFNTMIIL